MCPASDLPRIKETSPRSDSSETEGLLGSTARTAFQLVEQQRAHEYVAEQIRRQISLRLLPPGSALPPERELASLFGVGRDTIQHAIRVLEAECLLQTRRGRSGGTFVVRPASDNLAMGYLLARLRSDKERIGQVLEFRAALEPQVTAFAAKTAEPSSLEAAARASAIGAKSQTDSEFMGADTEFHLALARGTSNSFFVGAIEQIRVVLNDALVALPESQLWHERTLKEHAVVLAACKACDPERAAEAMTDHIRATEQSIRALLARI